MPYTRAWNSAAPNGATTDASDIDQVFQQFRVDVVERLNSIVGGADFSTADPVKFTAINFGVANGKFVAGPTALLFRDSTDAFTNLAINEDGSVTVRALLTVVAGGITVTDGTITAVNIVASGQTRNVPVAQSLAGNITIDLDTGNVQHVELTAGSPVITLSNGLAGSVYFFKVYQDGSGGNSYSFAAGSGTLRWAGGVAPTPTTTANKADLYSFYFDGTDYFGVQGGANL